MVVFQILIIFFTCVVSILHRYHPAHAHNVKFFQLYLLPFAHNAEYSNIISRFSERYSLPHSLRNANALSVYRRE